LIMLLNLACVLQANVHQFVHVGSQTPSDSKDSADDNMLSFHHGPCNVVPAP
jgi:hypothetical protein